jgi:tRNA/tmRNA/rRNA uracil-C5-methylase (TrmA/RlmC/RlmD family)
VHSTSSKRSHARSPLHQITPNPIVRIHDLSRAGSGVGRLESGEIVFVPFTVTGDRVEIKILKKKKNYAHAELIRIVEPSPDRQIPFCPVFGTCGGCTWQHVPYPLQFQTKFAGVLHALKRASITLPEDPEKLPAEKITHYRNRIQLHGNGSKKKIGFHQAGSHEIVSITECGIAAPEINQSLATIADRGFADFANDFKVEVELDLNGSIRSTWNDRHAALGFQQIHTEQNLILKNWIQTEALKIRKQNPKDPTILIDAYGGSGNLSLDLASSFSQVHCVDLGPLPPSTEVPSNFVYHRSTVTDWLSNYSRAQISASKTEAQTGHILIFDPPREGLGPSIGSILDEMQRLKVLAVLLVSCDVDSFVRDLTEFTQNGFKVQTSAVLDLFPQTPHVESLALLVPSQ